ncbi:MAG: response regulator, partial [Myxococcota bacterium]
KKLLFKLDIDSDFPSKVRVDGQRVLRVIGHLIDNGIKFTDAGRVELKVRFNRTEGANGIIDISVTDTGRGIPERDQAQIFSIFAQGDDSSTRAAGGTGLGLALVSRSIELLKGEVLLDSTVGKGSCFTIRVPAESLSAPKVVKVAEPSGEGRVLVVDDDRINRMLLRRMVQKEGFKVDLAEDGVEAVSLVQQNHYDLVFMDCEMPNMDGWEATRKIRETGSEQPIVAATAYVTPADRERCRDAGMNGFLAKPLSVKMVKSLLLRWVAHEQVTLPADVLFDSHPDRPSNAVTS